MAGWTLNVVISLDPKLSTQVDALLAIFTTPPLDTGPLKTALADLNQAATDLSTIVTNNP